MLSQDGSCNREEVCSVSIHMTRGPLLCIIDVSGTSWDAAALIGALTALLSGPFGHLCT